MSRTFRFWRIDLTCWFWSLPWCLTIHNKNRLGRPRREYWLLDWGQNMAPPRPAETPDPSEAAQPRSSINQSGEQD